jgi:hypothetical protein
MTMGHCVVSILATATTTFPTLIRAGAVTRMIVATTAARTTLSIPVTPTPQTSNGQAVAAVVVQRRTKLPTLKGSLHNNGSRKTERRLVITTVLLLKGRHRVVNTRYETQSQRIENCNVKNQTKVNVNKNKARNMYDIFGINL